MKDCVLEIHLSKWYFIPHIWLNYYTPTVGYKHIFTLLFLTLTITKK